MPQDRQEIAEKIRSGSYFKDAKEWYALKYLYPITERSMMFMFAVAALCAFIPIALLFKETVQTNSLIPLPIYVKDSTDYFSVISSLSGKDESPQEAVAKYLISDYVKSREEYSSTSLSGERLKKLLKKIKSSSEKTVLNEYTNYMSEGNPYSPLVRYKDHTNRFIKIKSLSFLDNDQTSGKARVIFEATEVPQEGETKTGSWEAMINFRLPDVVTISKTGAPLRFLVGYYRAKPLSAQNK